MSVEGGWYHRFSTVLTMIAGRAKLESNMENDKQGR